MNFTPDMVQKYLDEPDGREKMILKDYPTITTCKYAYGLPTIRLVLKQHVTKLANAFGLSSTDEQIDDIADDIISGYGDFKITEFILALKMMREGRFRNGEDNRAKMYGVLSSEVITDCLYKFRFEYRNNILDKENNRIQQQKLEEADRNAATYEQRVEILFCSVLENPSAKDFIKSNSWLKKEDMKSIEYYSAERKALLLLKQRVEEFIESVNNGSDPKVGIAKLEKGVKYINENYPSGLQGDAIPNNKV